MALIKPETANAKDETVNETATVEETVKPEVKQENKEVAVKQETGAVAASTGFWFTNPVVQSVVDSASYGDFPQLVATGGCLQEAGADGRSLGKWVAFKPIQAKIKSICSPNSNDDEAKEYFAAAYEGELTMDGRTIEDCVDEAKAAGYEKADIKKYIDLFAYVVSQEEGEFLIDEVVVMQLSPMSVIEWRKFSKKLEMQAAFGKLALDGECVVKAVAANAKNKAGKGYTKYTFEMA